MKRFNPLALGRLGVDSDESHYSLTLVGMLHVMSVRMDGRRRYKIWKRKEFDIRANKFIVRIEAQPLA